MTTIIWCRKYDCKYANIIGIGLKTCGRNEITLDSKGCQYYVKVDRNNAPIA